MSIISTYEQMASACHAYHPQSPAVATILISLIHARDPRLVVHHVGSTSVPACAGKGVIDLLVAYPAGLLSTARELLQALGFQASASRNPFPEDRPMRVGSLHHDGRRYLIHAHVVSAQSPEVDELLWFRARSMWQRSAACCLKAWPTAPTTLRAKVDLSKPCCKHARSTQRRRQPARANAAHVQ